jgi:hypothetical protein
MFAAGYKTIQIADALNCTIGTVQLHRLKGLRSCDPRSFVPAKSSKRIILRHFPAKLWKNIKELIAVLADHRRCASLLAVIVLYADDYASCFPIRLWLLPDV